MRFARHYLEMAGAMLVGMVALGRLESLLATAVGRPHAVAGATVAALVTAANMTAVTVAWMWVRGHGPRLIGEMVAGMGVGFLALAPQWIGAAAGHHSSMATGHDLMFLGMLVAMLGRREHYSEPETGTTTRRPS